MNKVTSSYYGVKALGAVLSPVDHLERETTFADCPNMTIVDGDKDALTPVDIIQISLIRDLWRHAETLSSSNEVLEALSEKCVNGDNHEHDGPDE